MSKAFTKEDQDAAPLLVPARAPLPDGTPNYVTERGLELLQEERRALDAEHLRLQASLDGSERARALTLLNQRIYELEQRLSSALLVDSALSHPEVRFGAWVRVRTSDGVEQRYRIVGVDEADAKAGLIAFVAPMARALLGRRVGESTVLQSPRGAEELELLGVAYSGDDVLS